jgi:hypothetical protein
MADAGDIKATNNNLEPAPANQERLSHFQPSSNNINVPTAAASTGPRHSAFTKPKDTPVKEDDFEYCICKTTEQYYARKALRFFFRFSNTLNVNINNKQNHKT